MADITIRLVANAETGKKDIYIDYHSDRDALPIEHEQDHRGIVEALLGRGVLRPDAVGDITVSRVEPVAGGCQTPELESGELKVDA